MDYSCHTISAQICASVVPRPGHHPLPYFLSILYILVNAHCKQWTWGGSVWIPNSSLGCHGAVGRYMHRYNRSCVTRWIKMPWNYQVILFHQYIFEFECCIKSSLPQRNNPLMYSAHSAVSFTMQNAESWRRAHTQKSVIGLFNSGFAKQQNEMDKLSLSF